MMRYGNGNQGIMPTVGVGVLPLSPSYRIDRDLAADLGDLRTDPKAPTFGQWAMAAADLPAQLPIPKPRELAPGEIFQKDDDKKITPLPINPLPIKKLFRKLTGLERKVEPGAEAKAAPPPQVPRNNPGPGNPCPRKHPKDGQQPLGLR